MERRAFGPTAEQVSTIGQGTWQLRLPEDAERALVLGLDLGLNHIDTAELYRGSEEIIAKAMAGRREDAFLVSKVRPPNTTYKGTLRACEGSLERLQVDRLDVYLQHWWTNDPEMRETMRAMGELIDRGKIRFAGVSNFDVAQLEAAQSVLGRHKLACDQVFYDMGHRGIERELVPYCQKQGIAVVAYSPFGSGRFPGPRTRGGQALAEVAQRNGLTQHQVVLNFLARLPNVFVIPKSENPEHVRQNAASLGAELSADDLRLLDETFPVPSSRELAMI